MNEVSEKGFETPELAVDFISSKIKGQAEIEGITLDDMEIRMLKKDGRETKTEFDREFAATHNYENFNRKIAGLVKNALAREMKAGQESDRIEWKYDEVYQSIGDTDYEIVIPVGDALGFHGDVEDGETSIIDKLKDILKAFLGKWV